MHVIIYICCFCSMTKIITYWPFILFRWNHCYFHKGCIIFMNICLLAGLCITRITQVLLVRTPWKKSEDRTCFNLDPSDQSDLDHSLDTKKKPQIFSHILITCLDGGLNSPSDLVNCYYTTVIYKSNSSSLFNIIMIYSLQFAWHFDK